MHGVCHLKERRKILIHPRWSIRRRVRLRSGICSRNLFILLLVFVVCRIEEKEKEVEESQYPASQGAISFSFRRLLISRGHQFLYYLRNLSLPLSLSPSLSLPSILLFLIFCPGFSDVLLSRIERASSDCKLARISCEKVRSSLLWRGSMRAMQHHPSALLHSLSNTVMRAS